MYPSTYVFPKNVNDAFTDPLNGILAVFSHLDVLCLVNIQSQEY